MKRSSCLFRTLRTPTIHLPSGRPCRGSRTSYVAGKNTEGSLERSSPSIRMKCTTAIPGWKRVSLIECCISPQKPSSRWRRRYGENNDIRLRILWKPCIGIRVPFLQLRIFSTSSRRRAPKRCIWKPPSWKPLPPCLNATENVEKSSIPYPRGSKSYKTPRNTCGIIWPER